MLKAAFAERHGKTTFTYVVARRNKTVFNGAQHHVLVVHFALKIKVEQRTCDRAALKILQLRAIKIVARFAYGVNNVAWGCKRRAGNVRHVFNQANHTNHGRRHNCVAVGFVVERHVARHNGRTKRCTCRANTTRAFFNFIKNFGVFWITKV